MNWDLLRCIKSVEKTNVIEVVILVEVGKDALEFAMLDKLIVGYPYVVLLLLDTTYPG